jgi:hypothetical protein
MRTILDIALIATAAVIIVMATYTISGIWPYAGVRAF